MVTIVATATLMTILIIVSLTDYNNFETGLISLVSFTLNKYTVKVQIPVQYSDHEKVSLSQKVGYGVMA
jgi:hypothetical protein